jgi:hypothetical protein
MMIDPNEGIFGDLIVNKEEKEEKGEKFVMLM